MEILLEFSCIFYFNSMYIYNIHAYVCIYIMIMYYVCIYQLMQAYEETGRMNFAWYNSFLRKYTDTKESYKNAHLCKPLKKNNLLK